MKPRVYLAGSWRCSEGILIINKALRALGIETYCFCDSGDGHYAFNIAHRLGDDFMTVDAITALVHDKVRDDFKAAFACDKDGLDWANTLVLRMPCNRSGHMEAGYVKGKGGRVFVYWLTELPKGEFEAMYLLTDGMFRMQQITPLANAIKELLYLKG